MSNSETLGDYLRNAADAGHIDHALRAHVDTGGAVTFTIHPADADGETLDCVVTGEVARKRIPID